MTHTILLVEDNPITRKLVRFTLEREGLTVIDAPDGKEALQAFTEHPIALVLQDICLPDMDGFGLVTALRALPGGKDVPMLVFSGMISRHDEARIVSAGFDDLITKPIEPSRLVQIVRTHLPPSEVTPVEMFGKGRRIVVADDDAVQRKLAVFRMQRVGFEVFGAADGSEALALARRHRPDVILSDVLMPGLDGFSLCQEVRRDPDLSTTPVVLATNSYVEPIDRDLARRAGAHDLVLRTPELREVLLALRSSLERVAPSRAPALPGELDDEHMRRMMRQLEKQVALNAGASQRCAVLSAEMSVLRGISEALANHEDIDGTLRDTLAACFDAGGVSLGALFLSEGEALRVLSFGFLKEGNDGELLSFFGERALLDEILRAELAVTLRLGGEGAKQRFLERAGVASALVVPLAYRGQSFGALLMLSKDGELENEDRLKFSEAVAGQITQALAVANAFQERERSEKAAREQTSVLRSILESIGDGVVVADASGTLTHSNPAAKHLVAMGALDEGFQTHTAEYGLYSADQVSPIPFDRLPLVQAMRGESVDSVEMFVRHGGAPDGSWLSVSGRPWRDDRGVPRGGVAVFRDVTQEKATQSQLMVSDRLASVGMLAAGVAHEMNNPLACVLANLDLSLRSLADRAPGDETVIGELREMLGDARSAADRVRQVVRDLRLFSRHEEGRPGPVDIHKVLDSTLRMAWTEVRHRARLVKDFGKVPPVEATESRLGQVFLNLLVNAAQAIPEGHAEDNTIRIATRSDSAGRVVVEITDTGSGIPAAVIPRLFTPFFTTKEPGVGTGLGLAICHRIVVGFGGDIQLQSEVGHGTTFRVTLPAARAENPREAERARTTLPATWRGRVLVIDDEPMIGAVIRRLLATEHDVVVTTSAHEALALLAQDPSFDLVLCDLMMPQMTGMDLHTELKASGLRYADELVFLTGGAFTAAAHTFLDEMSNEKLEKPFDGQHLRSLVNDRVRSRREA